MTLDKKLRGLHPFESDAVIEVEQNRIVQEYGANPKNVAEYLVYKYQRLAKEEKPLGFLLWYVDIYKPQVRK